VHDEPVESTGIQSAALDQVNRPLHAVADDVAEHPDVLPEIDRAGVGGRVIARIVEPRRHSTAVLGRANVHARLEAARPGLEVNPFNSEAEPLHVGGLSQHRGARTVREHPAKKLHVEFQRPDMPLRFEPARLEQAARELARARHGGLLAVRDMERGCLQRHHAACAHSVQRRDFAWWRPDLRVDHAGEAGQRMIGLGCRGREKIDVCRLQAGSLDGALHRARSHFGVRKHRLLLLVDRVVAGLDSVLIENPGSGS
jgi:hypothetical protein